MENVAKIVSELNESIFEVSENLLYTLYLEYISTPIGDYIKYAGQYIWDSENEYREWVDYDEGIREDLKSYLWQQMSLIKNSIYKSMVAVEKEIDS